MAQVTQPAGDRASPGDLETWSPDLLTWGHSPLGLHPPLDTGLLGPFQSKASRIEGGTETRNWE